MNVSFTKQQREYIEKQVASGDYQNNSEVVRDALRLHEIYRHKVIADLRAEIQKGRDSGYSNKTMRDILAEKQIDV